MVGQPMIDWAQMEAEHFPELFLAWKRKGPLFESGLWDPIGAIKNVPTEATAAAKTARRRLFGLVSNLASVQAEIPYDAIRRELVLVERLLTPQTTTAGPATQIARSSTTTLAGAAQMWASIVQNIKKVFRW